MHNQETCSCGNDSSLRNDKMLCYSMLLGDWWNWEGDCLCIVHVLEGGSSFGCGIRRDITPKEAAFDEAGRLVDRVDR